MLTFSTFGVRTGQKHAAHMVNLMIKLRRKRNGFWNNRHNLLEGFTKTVIALVHTRIVGFYIISPVVHLTGVGNIDIIESFVKGMGRKMVEHAKTMWKTVCYSHAVAGSEGFWDKMGLRLQDDIFIDLSTRRPYELILYADGTAEARNCKRRRLGTPYGHGEWQAYKAGGKQVYISKGGYYIINMSPAAYLECIDKWAAAYQIDMGSMTMEQLRAEVMADEKLMADSVDDCW